MEEGTISKNKAPNGGEQGACNDVLLADKEFEAGSVFVSPSVDSLEGVISMIEKRLSNDIVAGVYCHHGLATTERLLEQM